MKKIKLPDLFKIRKRKECKTNNLRETMELLARVVDDKLYVSMMDLGMERECMDCFNNIVKWKAEYTEDWIKNKLLEKAHIYYEKFNGKPLFWQRIFG